MNSFIPVILIFLLACSVQGRQVDRRSMMEAHDMNEADHMEPHDEESLPEDSHEEHLHTDFDHRDNLGGYDFKDYAHHDDHSAEGFDEDHHEEQVYEDHH